MSTIKHATKTVTAQAVKAAGVNLDAFPSAGPHPNITGMKRLYWGLDAYCLRVGVYVYKVLFTIYDMIII